MIKTLKKDGYNLHIINTKKFKTISIKIVCHNKLNEEELSHRNLLADILFYSSKKYNDTRKINVLKENLYNVELFSGGYRNGTNIVTEFSLSCIEDAYTEKDNLKRTLDFLFECLNNPNVSNGEFDKSSFSIVKAKLKSAIKSEKNNPNNYAFQRYKSLIKNDELLIGSMLGTLDNLKKVTPQSLYKYYTNFFKDNLIDVYVLGNVDSTFIENYFDLNFKFKSNTKLYDKIDTTYSKDYSFDIESSKYNQSKLLMGATIKDLTEHEKKYAGIIYNIILGNSPNSKLFQNVREKKSYAYTISSGINRLDGMFIINAGISYKNYKDTINEIKEQIDTMKKGNFSLDEIKNAKEAILGILREIDDSPWSIIDHYNNYLYNKADALEVQKQEITKITKEDIVKVANKIDIDTIYLLKEKTYGEI